MRGAHWRKQSHGQIVSDQVGACSHYSQRFDDECKAEKRQEDDVPFSKREKDAAEAFQSAEEPFDLIALL